MAKIQKSTPGIGFLDARYVNVTGDTMTGALTIEGTGTIRDSATPTKQYRFRTSGSKLDLDAGGTGVVISTFANADFTGTQFYYFNFESTAHEADIHGNVFFRQGNSGADSGAEVLKILAANASGERFVFNGDGNDYDARFRGDNEFNLLFLDASTDRIGIASGGPAGKLHVDQTSETAAIPVLYLDQADVSEEIIEIASTAGTGNAIELVGAKTLTVTEFIKVTINGNTRYLQAGTIA